MKKGFPPAKKAAKKGSAPSPFAPGGMPFKGGAKTKKGKC